MSLRLTLVKAFFRAFAKPRLRRTTNPAIARRDFSFAARLFLARAPCRGVSFASPDGPV